MVGTELAETTWPTRGPTRWSDHSDHSRNRPRRRPSIPTSRPTSRPTMNGIMLFLLLHKRGRRRGRLCTDLKREKESAGRNRWTRRERETKESNKHERWQPDGCELSHYRARNERCQLTPGACQRMP